MSDAPSTNSAENPVASSPGTTVPPSRGPTVRQIGVVVVILGAAVLLTALTADVTKVSEPGVKIVTMLVTTNGMTLTNQVPFLPESAGNWQGGELQGLTKEEKAILPADTEGARRLYQDKAGNEVYCSVVLAGKDVTSIHRPELCLPGQGWKIESEYVEPIRTPAAAGGILPVMRMNAVRTVPLAEGGQRRADFIFVYWFVGKDRLTPYHWQRILWTTKDRVLHNRNHRWAYFLINARVKSDGAGTDAERQAASTEAMRTIDRFVQDIYPALALQAGGH